MHRWLTATAFLSLLVGGCSCTASPSVPEEAEVENSAAKEIERVLWESNAVFDLLEAEQSDAPFDSLLHSISKRLRTIDASGCPADFRVAHLRFIQSIEELRSYLQSRPGNLVQALELEILNVLSGKSKAEEVAEWDAAHQKPSDVWKELELIAAKHGAHVSPE